MLRNYRTKKTKYTQDDMSDYLNITTRTYQKIEKENECKLSQANLISKLFKDSIENIFFK